MILATLQRIAAMMDAEGIEAAPVLVSGLPSAPEEDVCRYLERAVVPVEETLLAEESRAAIQEEHYFDEDESNEGSSSREGLPGDSLQGIDR